MKDSHHYCVIMGGGVGSRFWPFSRTSLPKQFLDFFGTGRSLLQQTVDRFSKIIPIEHIFIVTNEKYAHLIQQQLPDLKEEQILLEPDRRNTAPCIAWASYHIQAIDPKANIVVAPSDHLILKEEEFLKAIQKSLDFVSHSDKLVTLGITPNRPETGYGYIQIDDEVSEDFHKVKTFTEKPQLELAKVFVESGEFYWNSGLFIWNVKTILAAFEQFLPNVTDHLSIDPTVYNTPREAAYIADHFTSCPSVSIDFGVMEKADNAFVLLGDFGWSDLGTWSSLHELYPKDEENNAVVRCPALLYDCKDNIIAVPENKLAVVKGLEGYLIAESKNVLLICKKDDEKAIRQFVSDTKDKLGNEYI
ncbi:MAG: mannose-1-phosphate guanylyltransferase [Bacteroidaceae bacterium]|nr:mannose-1-phosphate guanylyltransferase [Bacteroidaceae bacterium]